MKIQEKGGKISSKYKENNLILSTCNIRFGVCRLKIIVMSSQT